MGERDEPHSYRHEPSAPMRDYSLLIMETVEMSLGEMETTPAAPLRSFPPSICSSRSLFRGFCVSAAFPSGKRRGTIFIVVFRSKGSFGKKDRRQRSHEGQKGGSHTAKGSGRVGLCLWAFGPPLFCLLRSYAFFLPKNDPLKFIGHLDVVWVPETQKYRK